MPRFRADRVAHKFDRTPGLPPAGLEDPTSDETAERTLKAEGLAAPPTPDHMKKWRKDYTPGKQASHPGTSDDLDYKRLEVYGRSEPVGVKVHDVLNVAPKSYLIEKAVQKKEQIYLSQKREPLGIVGFSLLSQKLGLASLSKEMNLAHLGIVGLLGGIGFTMCLLLTEVAITGPTQALPKLAVLISSAAAAVIAAVAMKLLPEVGAADDDAAAAPAA